MRWVWSTLGLIGLAWPMLAAPALRWSPVVEPYNQIFPALELATAALQAPTPADPSFLGDPNSLIGARITASTARQRVRLTVHSDPWITAASFEGVLPEAGRTYTVYPSIHWNYDRLAAQRVVAPAVVRLRLEASGAAPSEQQVRVRVRSVNDALYWVGDPETGNVLDFTWLFAAYVNEEHPLVERILQEALRSGVVEGFDGYRSGDPLQVYRQVFALWYVLQQRGIRYASLARGGHESPQVLSQPVRFIDQSWENAQANCVDGTVLFASVLRRIGIDPHLVMVPEHAFLGFALDAHGHSVAYLETTWLGRSTRVVDGPLDALRQELPRGTARRSLAGFEAALAEGDRLMQAAGDRFNQAHSAEFQIIDVAEARAAGVLPITPR